ncbi:MAG TPA: pitrilysin family protein [Oligoflexus sp.]|uniref:M16 family metallopeptidase n=1 Tax=Oligoflexus sp. TaxID=1971216 RepID=UPI002D592CA3|nr:pitrilysin family protein [Oligoflexus sp.]HYX39534.1 pitrilysin family protein [Oligoflexus sp.]
MTQTYARLMTLATAALLTLAPYAQAETFKLPPYETYALPNGMKVYLMPQKEVPLLHVTVGIQSGSVLDGAQYGLASFTGDALNLGTKNYTKDKLEDLFDFHGAYFGSAIDQDFTTLQISLATKDADKLLPVFSEILRLPTFPDKEVAKLRDRAVTELKKAKESPNQVADQFFNRLVFDEHPYGTPMGGTPTSIGKLSRADLQKFHASAYRPQNAAISVVGDLDIASMKKLVEKNFGSWSSAATQAKPIANVSSESKGTSRVLLVNKDDASETTFRIGGMGVKRDDQNWIGLQVVNTILGGRFTSLLNEELRVKTGLTYGARSRFEGLKNAGTFSISSFTATETTSQALDLALKTYTGFVKAGVDKATLDSAKAYVKGQFPPRYETSAALSNLLVEMWVYNLSDVIINNFEAEVNNLTLTQANDLIKKHFPVENLDILLIGQASKIQDIAKKYGRVIKTDIVTAQEGRL